MSNSAKKGKLLRVTDGHSEAAAIFLNLSKDYFSDLPGSERENFARSVLARQGEPNRWLLLLRDESEYIGFVHVKIGGERPGWGFILEFFIVSSKRRLGWGSWLFQRVVDILCSHDVTHIWLWSAPEAEMFWRSLGFEETGETRNGNKVMILSLRKGRSG